MGHSGAVRGRPAGRGVLGDPLRCRGFAWQAFCEASSMSRLTVSLSAYGGTTLEVALGTLVGAGVSRVQLAVGVRPADHLHVLDRFPLEYSVHSNFALGTRDGDYCLVTGRCAPSFARMFDFCAARGISRYSFHTGRYRRSVMSPDAAYARFAENLARVADLAMERGIAIAVETMYPTQNDVRWVLDDDAQIRRFLEGDARVGLVADAAHVRIGSTQRRVGPRQTPIQSSSGSSSSESHGEGFPCA
jgi:sugar phosphate isomerase/epimerase